MIILLVVSVRRSKQLLTEVQAKIDRQARIDAAKNMENTWRTQDAKKRPGIVLAIFFWYQCDRWIDGLRT